MMYQFVMGLRSEYEPVRAQLLNRSPTPSLSEVLSSLTAEEARLRSLSSAPSVLAPQSVLVAAHRSRESDTSTPCEHCKKTTHRSEYCFAKYPEKLAEFRARRATRGRGTSATPRGYVSDAAASPIHASQSSWVLDSGASFHVTSDHSQFVNCQAVHNGPSVQTADGTSCPITSHGSLSTPHFFCTQCFFCTSVVHESSFSRTDYRSELFYWI